jgi:hypothetical protein
LLLFALTIGNAARSEETQRPDISPNTVEFGIQKVGSAGEPNVLTLSNPGPIPLGVTSILTSGIDFSQTNDCGKSVAPGSQCTIQLVFKPATIGPRIGQLSVITSVPIRAVPLSGTGQ